MPFSDVERVFGAMVTHWSLYLLDHWALSFQRHLRHKVEDKVTSKMHPLLPNCSEELCKVTDALADYRLPNHSTTPSKSLWSNSCNLTLPEFQMYFLYKLTEQGSTISRHCKRSPICWLHSIIFEQLVCLVCIIAFDLEFIIEEVRTPAKRLQDFKLSALPVRNDSSPRVVCQLLLRYYIGLSDLLLYK